MCNNMYTLKNNYWKIPEESKLDVVSLCTATSESVSFSYSSKIAESCTHNNNPPKKKKH